MIVLAISTTAWARLVAAARACGSAATAGPAAPTMHGAAHAH